MNKIKRILSMVLVCIMTLALFPVVSPVEVSAAEATGTTALFNGNATYLLQERFNEPKTVNEDNQTGSEVFSGWDIDYRGGKVDARVNGGYGVATLADQDGFEGISMNRKLMSHSGKGLVLEADFKYTSAVDSGFYYEMSGGGNTALKISVDRVDAEKPENCAIKVNGQSTGVACVKNTVYNIKAEFSGSKVAVWINGKSVANVDYVSPTSVIDEIEVGTLEETVATVNISYIYVYVNYTVNESFLSSSIKEWWDIANGNVTKAPGSPYTADPNGFALNSVEELEPDYEYDKARVRINSTLDSVDEITSLGANFAKADAKETISFEPNEIGGIAGTIKVVTDGTDTGRVGLKLADDFAFEEGDILTYSIDIYPETSIPAMTSGYQANLNYVMLRNHDGGDAQSQYRNVAPDITLETGKWQRITQTITFSDLKDCMFDLNKGKTWATVGDYELYMRFAGTYYLDNFNVTIKKADDAYFSDITTGERINYTNPVDVENDKNVLYSVNAKNAQYIIDSEKGRVLEARFDTAASNNSVIAFRLVDDIGRPITSFKAGDVIDLSVDIYSSVVQSSSGTNGICLRDGTMDANGANGPSTNDHFYKLREIKIGTAGTWEPHEYTYTVPSDITTTKNFFILIRPQSAGVIRVNDFKMTVRNPRDSITTVPFSAKAESAADITWKGSGNSASVGPYEDAERGSVISASITGGDASNVGFLLGNPYQFKQEDVLYYSFDIKSDSTFKPNVWIRNQDDTTNGAYKTFSHSYTGGSGWKTMRGSISYNQLISSPSNTPTKDFSTAAKYAIYIRPESGGADFYLDNFNVTVKNPNWQIVDIKDGTRFRENAYSVGGFTWGPTTLAASTTTADATGVVTATLKNVDENGLGYTFGGNFKFKPGDVLSYSVEIYTDQDAVTPDIWLRNKNGNSPFAKFFPTGALTKGTWNKLTRTATYEEIVALAPTVGSTSDGWDVASDKWALYIRPRGDAPVKVKNFEVSVKNEDFAFPEPSNFVLQKSFDELSGKQSFSFNVLVPNVDNGADGFGATFGGVDFKADGGKFKVGNTEVYSYRKNVWYKIEIQTDGRTADIYVNGVKKATGISAVGDMNSIAFENTSGRQIIIDDVQVCKAFDPSEYGDQYPSTPETVTTSYNLGMVSYPLWREGIQYGWDFISSFEERTPALGYYTGGSPEVADWNNKWLLEHGIDHMIFPMPRPDGTNNPIKMAVRGEELHDGFLNSKYRKTDENPNGLGFAIMITQPTNERYDSPTEFKEYVQPYLIEHYFKNPAYKKMKVGNQTRLVVYSYDFKSLATYLGDSSNYNNINTVLVNLDTEVRELGIADGIVFVTDLRSSEEAVNAYLDGNYSFKNYVYKWRYTYGTDDYVGIKEQITGEKSEDNGYSNDNNTVASIPMGFNTTPWYANWVGTISSENVQNLCTDVKSAYDKANGSEPNLFLFTCWDEWGEGHHFAPTEKNGVVDFSYLNAISKAFAGKEKNSQAPTNDAKKRMGVLYPEGRQMLKIRDRVIYSAADFNAGNELGYLDLTAGTRSISWSGYTYSNEGELNGVNSNRTSSNSKYDFTYKCDGGYAQQVTWNFSTVNKGNNFSNIDIRNITAIKIDGYADNSPEMVLKLGTSTTGEEFPGEYRFSGVASSARNGSVVLLPDNRTSLLNKANTAGQSTTVTKAQFNLTTYTRANSEFDINKITFYTGDLPGTTLKIDENPYTLISAPKKSGTNADITMIPAYKLLVDIGAKVTWKKEGTGGTLTAVKDGVTAVYVANHRDVVDENGNEIAKAPEGAGAIYDEGNLYVAYDVLLKPFGYTVNVVDGVIKYSNKFTGMSYNQNDYKWDFEIDGDLDGWYSGESEPYPIFVKNGMLHQRAITRNSANQDDAKIFRDNVNIPKANANYFAMNFKKTDYDTYVLLRLYDTGKFNTASGLVYEIRIPKSDNIQKLIVDLNKGTATVDGNEVKTTVKNGTYSELDTTSGITKLRIDTMDSLTVYGSMYIDSIEFTKNHPDPFTVKAYAFGENLLNDNNNPYWVYSNALNKNGTAAAGFGLTPYVVTDGEYTNVYKIQPSKDNTTGLAGITRLKQSEYNSDATKDKDLGYHVKDKWVKVSFDYKGYGDCTEFKFENRDTDAPTEGDDRYPNEKHLDGESFGGKVSNEWQHFEGYFKVDEINDGRRWFAIRATRKSASGDGALLVKDWKIHILDEVTEVDYFTDSGVAIRVFDNVGAGIADNAVVHVGAFKIENKELTGFDSGSTIEAKDSTTPHYYIAPTDEATELRTYIWNDFEPLTQPFVFQKK